MTIRAVEEKDIPALVGLLKSSLGESLLPKSEAFWRWKHNENPFGPSPVLLAEENDQLVGVRAFMRWEWKFGNKIYRAVRAVDTATHPQHQGKGIFKKLTLQLVQYCKEEGIDFIFNTPNKDSKPGYLKMGWQEHGKMSIHIRPLLTWRSTPDLFEKQYRMPSSWQSSVPVVETDRLQTNFLTGYLGWRYASNPLIPYYVFGESGSYEIIFRLKPGRFGTEFRVVEALCAANCNGKAMADHLQRVATQSGSRFISFAPARCSLALGALKLPIGPMVTVRWLNEPTAPLQIWERSLGDMELF